MKTHIYFFMMTFQSCFYYLGEIILDDSPENYTFFATEHLRLKREGPIISVNGNFCKWFTNGSGKIEPPQEEGCSLPIHVYASKPTAKWDYRTFGLLGGFDSLEISLRDVYRVIEKFRMQPRDKHLISLKGFENCFLVRDMRGNLRRLIVGFSNEGKFLISARNLFDGKTRPLSGTRFFSALKVE
jgi:hypothetical protein